MKIIKYVFFIAFFSTLVAFSIQKNSVLDIVQQKLDILNIYYPHEKIYLHFDKPYYSANETIWFKLYLTNASTIPDQEISGLTYVELIGPDDKLILTKKLKVDNRGAAGEFVLPRNTMGTFHIRAYTNFMRNFDDAYFYSKKITVYGNQHAAMELVPKSTTTQTQDVSLPDFDIQFFPEGGNLIAGLSSNLGFKAISPDGKGLDVSGEIFNQTGQSIGTFESVHRGIGAIAFLPQDEDEYFAIVKSVGFNDQKVNLPKAELAGIALKVINVSNHLILIGNSTDAKYLTDALLIGQCKGQIIFSIPSKEDQTAITAKIHKESIPEGVLQVTLFDRDLIPRCERLVFVQHGETDIQLDVKSDKTRYNKRALVKVTLDLKDTSDSLGANLSMAITDKKIVQQIDDVHGNIKTYFLLSSDVKGNIEDPDYYFENDDPERKKALDMLMMTQGWRRYNWQDLLTNNYPYRNYIIESGLNISGTIRNNTTNKPVRGLVSVTTTDPFQYVSVTADTLGRFLFFGIDSYDTTEFVIQAGVVKGQKKNGQDKLNKNVDIDLNTRISPPIPKRNNTIYPIPKSSVTQEKSEEEKTIDQFIEASTKIQDIEKSFDFEKTYMLETVDIIAKSELKKESDLFYLPGKIYDEPDFRLMMDSVGGAEGYSSVMDVLRGQVPGVDVRGNFPNFTINIRGIISVEQRNEPLFILDGVPSNKEIALLVNPADVFFIDVLKGASAAVYGSRGAAGVIVIYTKRGAHIVDKTQLTGILNFKLPGYNKAKEFYSPKYDVEKPEHSKPDFRTTLYWNPTILLDQNGKAEISFYTSDASSTYEVRVEGLTTNGNPIVSNYTFQTE